jgi:hypothetical protein
MSMRLRYFHHRQELLDQDFEIPKELAGSRLHLNRLRSAKGSGLLALQLSPPPSAGIWDRSGKLVYLPPNAKDVVLLPGEKELLVLEPAVRNAADPKVGVPSVLKRVDLASRMTLAEGRIVAPTNIGQSLVLAPKGDRALVTWHEQTEWGYVTFDPQHLKQLPPVFEWRTLTDSPPSFSPDGKLVVSCNYVQEVWWAGKNGGDWHDPSPGGAWKVATIVVHELASGQTSQHDLLVTVDEGWLPDRPEEREWQQVWGPDFVSDRQFRIWLPDDSEEILSLPLPPRIEIGRPLRNTRVWPE